MKNRKPPSYRHHKATGQAFVELSGKRIYLGKHGTPASKAEYKRLIAEWLGNGRAIPVPQKEITVLELCARFLRHAETYYRKPDGTPTSEVCTFKTVVRILTDIYGETPASDFGPRALKAVREKMIVGETHPGEPTADGGAPKVRKPWSRRHVNEMTSRVRMIFKWAVAEELIAESVYAALHTVPGLKRGRCNVPDNPPVKPVHIGNLEAVKAHVSRQVAAIIDLQLLTGARAGEIVGIRPIDIDTTGKVWTCTPAEHKTAHHGHARTIYFGPRAQEIIRPFLAGRPVDYPLFCPKEAESERRERMHGERVTPLSCGNRPGTNRVLRPHVAPGDAYDVSSYRRAISRGCVAAGVPHWHPHQIRHTSATHLRKEFGLESARIILGHKSVAITELYAELDAEKAVAIVERVG